MYHHLDPKYAPPREEGKPRKALFSPRLGGKSNFINFPMLEAVLAGLWQQRRRDRFALVTASLSIGISVASLLVSVVD